MHDLNIREDIEDLEWKELYPGILVYRNMLKDPEKAYKIMMDSEASSGGRYFFKEWAPWAQFGTYTQSKDEYEMLSAEKNQTFDFPQQI